jgi:enoyl-CoA hydratase/carnithine racemase
MHRDLWAALDKVEANKAIRALVLTAPGARFAPARTVGVRLQPKAPTCKSAPTRAR